MKERRNYYEQNKINTWIGWEKASIFHTRIQYVLSGPTNSTIRPQCTKLAGCFHKRKFINQSMKTEIVVQWDI